MKLSHQYFIQSIFWVLLSLVVTQNTWALRCLEGGKPTSSFDISKASNTSHTTSIGNIRVTNTSQAAGTLLWESQTFSTTFTCFDDYSTNSSENAYLYLDDTVKSLDALFKSSNLIIGVRYEGKEYPIGTVERINLAKLALQAQSNSSQAKSNCTLIKKNSNRCADPQTITVNYSLYIKSRGTGKNLESLNKTFQIFQLDGEGGRNISGNFQEKVSDMTVNYIECIPVLTSQDVNLGSYSSLAELNTILRKVPFTLNIKTEGKNCTQYPFVGRFTSNQKYNATTITASETTFKNIVGIQIFPSGDNQPITLEKNIDLGFSNGTLVSKNFEAGVLFLQKPTNGGRFTSTLNYDVYYK
jgi:hypothetical protein